MADFDHCFDGSEVPDDWLTEMNLDASRDAATPCDQDQYMMNDYESRLPEENPEGDDVSISAAEVPDSQQFSPLPSQEATTPPQLSRPNFFNPSNVMNTPIASRPNFFNPSTTGPRARSRRSIFGPTKSHNEEEIKDEDGEDSRMDVGAPTSSYRESIQPQTPITTPIRAAEDSPLNRHNETTPAARNASKTPMPSPEKAGTEDDTSDDDVSIITPDEASMEAQSRWVTPYTFIPIEDDEVSLKPEPTNDDEPALCLPSRSPPNPLSAGTPEPDMAAIRARQRAVLKKNKNKDPGKDAFRPHGNRRPLEPETSPDTLNKKRRRSSQIVLEDPEQVDAAMRADSREDDSWMHDEAEGDDDEECSQLRIRVDDLARREKNGKISPLEVIELGGLRRQLGLKEKLIRCARGSPSRQPMEESLFVPESFEREESLDRHRSEQHALKRAALDLDSDREGEGDDTGERTSREGSDDFFSAMLQAELDGEGLDGVPSPKEMPKPSKKPRRKAGKTAREVYQRDQEVLREKERAKMQKQKAKSGKGGKGSGPY